MNYLIVFLATFFADVAWTLYLIKVEERKPVQSALWGCVIFLFGAITTTHYIANKLMLIPALVGSFLGVYVIVQWKRVTSSHNGS
jgi:uncharacterized membrane protein